MPPRMNSPITNIYVLRLEHEKYYVGKTENIQERYEKHLKGRGCIWTKKYKPVKLIESFTNVSTFEEDKITKQYMAKYGIDNVRGGSYTSEILDETQKEYIQKEIWMAKNCCINCGSADHFAKECNAIEYIEQFTCDYCDDAFCDEKTCTQHERLCSYKYQYMSTSSNNSCYRCGRPGHYANDCYAKTWMY